METKLSRSTAAAEAVSAAAIKRFLDRTETEGFNTHSFMMLVHGKVVAETWWAPFRPDENHLLYSLTKSFASTAVGFAIAEGALGLDDLVIELLPDQVPENPSENLKKLKVRHLLSMSVGHAEEPNIFAAEGTWDSCATRFLAHPVPHEPGTHFLYNTAASQILSILVQRTTGEGLDQFLSRRLFKPLGIETIKWSSGVDFVWGGSGLFATTESIAKLGLLYLNGGKWEGDQLLPKGWAEEATKHHVSNGTDEKNDWNQGYGFQFWRCRHHAFRGDGAFGQICLVLPDQDAVIAITSGNSDMQAVLNAIWEILLPAFGTGGAEVEESNRARSLPVGTETGTDPKPLQLVNEQEEFEVRLTGNSGDMNFHGKVPLSLQDWVEFDYSYGRGMHLPARARAGWNDSKELVVRICNPHAPTEHRITIGTDGEVTFEESGVFDPLPAKKFLAIPIA